MKFFSAIPNMKLVIDGRVIHFVGGVYDALSERSMDAETYESINESIELARKRDSFLGHVIRSAHSRASEDVVRPFVYDYVTEPKVGINASPEPKKKLTTENTESTEPEKPKAKKKTAKKKTAKKKK